MIPLYSIITPDPHEVKGDGSEENTVDKIDRRKRYNRWEYRARWRGYGLNRIHGKYCVT